MECVVRAADLLGQGRQCSSRVITPVFSGAERYSLADFTGLGTDGMHFVKIVMRRPARAKLCCSILRTLLRRGRP